MAGHGCSHSNMQADHALGAALVPNIGPLSSGAAPLHAPVCMRSSGGFFLSLFQTMILKCAFGIYAARVTLFPIRHWLQPCCCAIPSAKSCTPLSLSQLYLHSSVAPYDLQYGWQEDLHKLISTAAWLKSDSNFKVLETDYLPLTRASENKVAFKA
eukprot:1159744-Pelagomonas_calceolata.AAC.2